MCLMNREMQAFDDLPADIREILRNMSDPPTARSLWDNIHRGATWTQIREALKRWENARNIG
jgi:hypothetical protein